MTTSKHLYRLLGLIEETVAAVLLVGIAAIVLLQVFGRYILPNPFIWPEEVSRLMLIWLTFIGAAAVTRRGSHIAVDMVLRLLRGRAAIALALFVQLVLALVFAWIAVLTATLADRVATIPLAATRWPMAVMIWPAVVGCGLIALHAAVRTIMLTRAMLGDQRVQPSDMLDPDRIRS